MLLGGLGYKRICCQDVTWAEGRRWWCVTAATGRGDDDSCVLESLCGGGGFVGFVANGMDWVGRISGQIIIWYPLTDTIRSDNSSPDFITTSDMNYLVRYRIRPGTGFPS